MKSDFNNNNNQKTYNYQKQNENINKQMIPSKSEICQLNNLVFDDENNLINLTKSLSFSNSRYKKTNYEVKDYDQNNNFSKLQGGILNFIKY